MARELLISAGPGEWRAALLEEGVPVELYVERGERSEAGSIHLGRVVRLLPGLGATLVDIGGDRPAFLPQREVLPRGTTKKFTAHNKMTVSVANSDGVSMKLNDKPMKPLGKTEQVREVTSTPDTVEKFIG